MFGLGRKSKGITADSLESFIRLVSETRSEWQKDPAAELWFRGEGDEHADTALQPRLYRETGKPLAELLKIENRLFDEFSRCGAQLCDKSVEEDWDWYFLMQHHGGPTRLLDWSDGALMALHFAVRSKPPSDLGTDCVVYLLDPYWLIEMIDAVPATKKREAQWRKKVEGGKVPDSDWEELADEIYLPGGEEDFAEDPLPEEPLVLDFPHITRRVAAQRSRFIVFGTDRRWLSNLLEKANTRLRRVTIPKSAVSSIQRDLRVCGVTESVIFPDLDGLGREISQLWAQYRHP